MNKQYKPFRLINNLELQKLKHDFDKKLQAWNQQYALLPLSFSLIANQKPNVANAEYIFVADTQVIAFLPVQDLSVLKHCLFDDASDCFKDIGETMLLVLFRQLFERPSLQQSLLDDNRNFLYDEWFYTGSPTVSLTLEAGTHSLTVYLHPQWVLQALPMMKPSQKSRGDLQAALDSQKLHCQVEFNSITLQLESLVHLKPGDVVTIDHTLGSPLTLKHGQQTVCHVEPGEINSFKSIKIVSST